MQHLSSERESKARRGDAVHSSALKCVTWFLKEKFLTGSSAARLMLLSRMKKRMRLVKMLWLTILWHVTLNLRKEEERQEGAGSVTGRGRVSHRLFQVKCERKSFSHLLVLLKMKKARASGMGTAFSFSWMSESGRGLGPTGISGSSSSSSPDGGTKGGDE